MKIIYLFIILIISLYYVDARGYAVYPRSRQAFCADNRKNNFFYPLDGSGIKDPACRKAWRESGPKFVMRKNEYTVYVPHYKMGINALQAQVPRYLCSAGDVYKSGNSIPNIWTATVISVPYQSLEGERINYKYCETSITRNHESNLWEFYITEPGFNIDKQTLTWDDLIMFYNVTNILPEEQQETNEYCPTGTLYKIPITLPVRYERATLLVRYQSTDLRGKCEISCSDYLFKPILRKKLLK
ncbi:hypothetical protein CYY_005017 [Polysphondylium violaceum]|uniref:Chitin-binding type-4 domain-containing protein n=1 Tax=Polysphondylium violaceum TaxID=133409 RepID=A0A8J4V4L7_9MYCE|nr:hypothetical protein CYY_005017 [Polysphondylium violaceum]